MKIGIISDSPTLRSGYGVVARGLGKYLMRRGVEVFYVGFQYVGEPCLVEIDGKHVKMYQFLLDRVLSIEKPEACIHIRDPFVFTQKYFPQPYSIAEALRKHRCRSILWVPVMSTNYPREVVEAMLREGETILTFTEWGRTELVMCGVPYNRMEVLHPGVDFEIFRRIEVSKKEFGAYGDRKLIGFVGVDQSRKVIPLILYVVSKVVEHVDCDLFLITPQVGLYDLPNHIEASNMKGRVLFQKGYDRTWGWPLEKMARWYNALDLYISLSSSEGFNLPIVEAAACTTPVVASQHPVHVEVLGELGVYVDAKPILPNSYSLDYLITDIDEAAEKVVEALEKGRLKDVSQLKKYDWNLVVEKLLKVVE
jgi:glycosyltransferase involved in cell wall biosynthesis